MIVFFNPLSTTPGKQPLPLSVMSLAAVVETYLNSGGQIGKDIFAGAIPMLRKSSVSAINRLAADERFKKALRAAAVTREMKEAQNTVTFEKYLRPALEICDSQGFVLPLSLAVVSDSLTHGSWGRIAARVNIASKGATKWEEKAWITGYVRRRHLWLTNISRLKPTSYRTKFFLDQIAIGNWELRLPMTVHGVKLTEAILRDVEKSHNDTVTRSEAETETVESGSFTVKTKAIGEAISSAAAKFDRVDAAVTAVTSRKDAAKSLWTTIAGTIWQMAWAVFGFLVGLPKIVWIVVAVIAAVLMLAYLYRQITFGKIREMKSE